MQDFRNLRVWQRAHELALSVYRLTADFPPDEVFGLRHAMRKVAVDIPAFVAEGSGKTSDTDFSRSIGAAVATANKPEYYAIMAKDLTFLSESDQSELKNDIVEVKKMLNGFNRSLK